MGGPGSGPRPGHLRGMRSSQPRKSKRERYALYKQWKINKEKQGIK